MYSNSGNILFISDEEHELNVFRSQFVRSYDVFTASSIREGFKFLQDYDIHVMLIKQKMANMTGVQFCESIAQTYPEVIKIVLNDRNDTEALKRAVQSELIYRYIQQPYQADDLKMTLDGALRLSQARFKNRELNKQLNQFKTEQENILQLFKKYVPAEVVSEAIQSDDHHMKPGESRIVSVLFADIRDFTRFTADLRPSQVVEFLNNYWAEISECVKKNNGSINKYIGDGLLAIFGAPVSHINNHENAVNAALDMVEKLNEINAVYSQLFGAEINIGIGINSGEVVVGNIGTENYMEYTVIGDTVNVASRMEVISKQKPNSIIISENTYKLVKSTFETSELKQGRLTDKDQTIPYYEVYDKKAENVFDIRPHKGQHLP